MQRLGQHTMLHRQHHLDQPGHARRRGGVSDIGFDRAQPQGLGAVLSIGGQNRLGLNRIPQYGSGAVAFDHVHVGHPQPSAGQCRPNHPLL